MLSRCALRAAVLLLIGGSSTSLPAQQAAPFAVPRSAPSSVALPGARPGTERWIVHFARRGFDLTDFRAAVLARRSADEVRAIVLDLERRAEADQVAFVAGLEPLAGRVLAQWWIINACAVEVPAASVARLQALPNVARIEPDVFSYPGIKSATNHLNHNADAVNARGYRGAGSTIAIMDTGADEVVGTLSRPHRVYFVDGDPTKLTGGGIGGSRLVLNKKIGQLAPEDINGHGTAVAAIAAGGQWGTSGADHGHAYAAKIASYAIADQANSGSSQASLVSGWQAIAADRVAYDLDVANNSYQGTSLANPMGAVQLALDSAAFNADILVSVIAGNQANGAIGQSGANALVTASVYHDTHAVVPSSGHGPQVYDSQRFWPDIAAVGEGLVEPSIDCEQISVFYSGTSMAAPEVGGCAALLRAAVPTLRADETKAILLASAMDIAARNPSPPHNSRNAYGMGFLRDDVAIDTALAKRYGWARLVGGNPKLTFQFPVAAAKDHAVAITWHRKTQTNTQWSNLDLRVLDGTNVVATSATTRNLYEMVRFRPAQNATYTLEVTGPYLDGGLQEFAYAIAESLVEAPIAATYASFGAGCAGSGSNGAPLAVCAGANTTAIAITGDYAAEGFEFAVQERTTASPLTIQGYSMLVAARTPVPVNVGIVVYAGASTGEPTGPPLGTGTLVVGPTAAWYGTTFAAPIAIPAASIYHVSFSNPGAGVLAPIPSGSGPVMRLIYARTPCGATWVQTGQAAIAHRIHCAGAGSAVAPLLGNDGLPSPGQSFSLRLSHAKPSSAAALLTGVSDTTWSGLALPLDLGLFAAPGCTLLASGEVVTGLIVDAQGRAALAVGVPASTNLLGARFFQQFVVTDPVNLLGVVTSNGGVARVGLLP